MAEIATFPTASGVFVAGRTISRVVTGRPFARVTRGTLQDVGVVKFSAGPGDARVLMAASTVTGVVAGRAFVFVARGAL